MSKPAIIHSQNPKFVFQHSGTWIYFQHFSIFINPSKFFLETGFLDFLITHPPTPTKIAISNCDVGHTSSALQ